MDTICPWINLEFSLLNHPCLLLEMEPGGQEKVNWWHLKGHFVGRRMGDKILSIESYLSPWYSSNAGRRLGVNQNRVQEAHELVPS